MSLIVLDVELADKNVVKEVGVFIDGQVFGYSFKPPTFFQPTFQTHWCTNNLHKIDWRSGALDYNDVTMILTSLKQYRAEFFAKGLEKCTMLSALLGKQVENLDDYGCPKIQELNCDWLCSSYPYRHRTTLHCAEKRQKFLVHGLYNYSIGDSLFIVLFYKERINYFYLNRIFS